MSDEVTISYPGQCCKDYCLEEFDVHSVDREEALEAQRLIIAGRMSRDDEINDLLRDRQDALRERDVALKGVLSLLAERDLR